VAGCLVDGATLVISPLISLQHDQIDGIQQELPGEATALDASVSERQRNSAWRSWERRSSSCSWRPSS
jgi:ATP-dependent DNA helicase RecQ